MYTRIRGGSLRASFIWVKWRLECLAPRQHSIYNSTRLASPHLGVESILNRLSFSRCRWCGSVLQSPFTFKNTKVSACFCITACGSQSGGRLSLLVFCASRNIFFQICYMLIRYQPTRFMMTNLTQKIHGARFVIPLSNLPFFDDALDGVICETFLE